MKVGLTDLGYSTFLVHLKENNTNAVKFKILASVDNAIFETIKGETTLAKDGSFYETFSDPWIYVDVQFKADAAGNQGKLTVNISGA